MILRDSSCQTKVPVQYIFYSMFFFCLVFVFPEKDFGGAQEEGNKERISKQNCFPKQSPELEICSNRFLKIPVEKKIRNIKVSGFCNSRLMKFYLSRALQRNR